MKSSKMESLEKAELELSKYANMKNILVDGGVDIQDADEIIWRCHDKFHKEIKPRIIERAVQKVLEEMCNTPDVRVGDKIDLIVARIAFEIEKSFASDPEKEEKTIYRGLGGVELKESSNN